MPRPKQVDMINSKGGRLLTKEDEVHERWQEHFMEVLNRPHPVMTVEIMEDDDINEKIEEGPITKLKTNNVRFQGHEKC